MIHPIAFLLAFSLSFIIIEWVAPTAPAGEKDPCEKLRWELVRARRQVEYFQLCDKDNRREVRAAWIFLHDIRQAQRYIDWLKNRGIAATVYSRAPELDQ
jgi:hypothetical protein